MSGVCFILFSCWPRAGTRGFQGGSIHKVRAARRAGVGLERHVGPRPPRRVLLPGAFIKQPACGPGRQARQRLGRNREKIARQETFIAKARVKLIPKRKKLDVPNL